MAASSDSKNWSGTGQLRGGRTGIAFFLTAIRWLGPRVAYLLAIFPALYFSFASPDVPATMDFHRRLFGPLPGWKRRWFVFKHFYSFGRAIIDRTAILAGHTRNYSFTFDGEAHLRAAAAEGKGVLLLTAHVGNWEVAGQLLSRLGVPVNVTGFDRESPQIRALLDGAQAGQKFRLIPLTGAATDAIPLVAALRRGEVVAMLGDRPYGSPSTRVEFLGSPAALPVGAYVLAAIAGAPTVQVFSLREPGGHYHFFGFPALPAIHPPHHERDAHLKKCAAQFAANLESIVRRDPFQWYNFYPFWAEPTSSPSSHPLAAPATSSQSDVSARVNNPAPQPG
jgi:predicted LPLAT superfamily acyltransferase